MLEITRKHGWSRDHEIALDGSPVAHWRRRGRRSGGPLELAGETLEFHVARWGRSYELRAADAVRASAHRTGRVWEVVCDGDDYRLERISRFRRPWRLLHHGRELGTFTRTRPGRGLSAELGTAPVPVQVFTGLVVQSLWQRQDASTAAASSS
ncbi:hypothetical protein SAMN05216223_103148 [Actinacidiphila yanglinensis]|uniref:Uncharacterized protein n=1 Tax=Actinacidiphila yanglinensis TaxID=310779 RepID=A0A1H5X9Z7_9ACTN|nr:hypothetical protein [Actinacidiphila yanglinensis]SEG08056.1 hypothetical protein SAMN05216223_103148 [Actinacidiphila yanglinensis]